MESLEARAGRAPAKAPALGWMAGIVRASSLLNAASGLHMHMQGTHSITRELSGSGVASQLQGAQAAALLTDSMAAAQADSEQEQGAVDHTALCRAPRRARLKP